MRSMLQRVDDAGAQSGPGKADTPAASGRLCPAGAAHAQSAGAGPAPARLDVHGQPPGALQARLQRGERGHQAALVILAGRRGSAWSGARGAGAPRAL